MAQHDCLGDCRGQPDRFMGTRHSNDVSDFTERGRGRAQSGGIHQVLCVAAQATIATSSACPAKQLNTGWL